MAKKTDTKYSKETTASIKQLEKYLKETYGEIKPVWNNTLTIIADALDMIEKCKLEIEKHGIYNPSTGRKNPLIATVKDYQQILAKNYQMLGVTPWSESKIKMDDSGEEDELLKSIIG